MSGFEPYPSDRFPDTTPPRPAAPGHLLGRAQSVQLRQERVSQYSSLSVLSLRLTNPGAPPLDVELRGMSISGSVHDGDWVEIAADTADRTGRYEVQRLTNLTTNARVDAVGSPKSTGIRVFRVVFVIVFVAILIAIGVVAYLIFRQFP